eukprot:6175122-Pleurochrysis_carterae.AAC.1
MLSSPACKIATIATSRQFQCILYVTVGLYVVRSAAMMFQQGKKKRKTCIRLAGGTRLHNSWRQNVTTTPGLYIVLAKSCNEAQL